MRKYLLSGLIATMTLPLMVWALQKQDLSRFLAAFAEPTGLMQGCMDVPEAVLLAETLQTRALRIERYMETIDAKKAEVEAAEKNLREKLAELSLHKRNTQVKQQAQSDAVRTDIDRLIAVYDRMKPAEAAAILTNLPVDFAAEILVRVQPESGARIIAAVEPRQAALLTAQIGARSVRNQ